MKKQLMLLIAAIGTAYVGNHFLNGKTDEVTDQQDVQKQSRGPTSVSGVATSKAVTGGSTGGKISDDELKRLLVRMEKLSECYENEKCAFPKTDPKSYTIALNQDVATLLKGVTADKVKSDEKIQKLVKKFMIDGDGYVQEESLRLLADLPISEENLNSVIEGMKNNYSDPLIMEQVIAELARYNDSNYESQVREFVSETILSGPQYSAEAVAKKIRPLLNANNVTYYQSVSEQSKSTAIKTALQSSLKDYSLSLSGG